jgi:DNA polymerase
MICDMAPGTEAKAHVAYETRGKRSGMEMRSWVAAEIVKLMWREAHPNITQYWWEIQDAALEALDSPGVIVQCGKVRFRKAGSFMFLQLPSGRALVYPYPRRAMKEMPWDGDDGEPAFRNVFSYKGVDPLTRKWTDQYAYGGLWAENVTQATARDVLAEALPRLETAGYPVIMHSHDEAVSEVQADFGNVEQFCRIMATPPPWSAGCPIAAEGWEGARYRK